MAPAVAFPLASALCSTRPNTVGSSGKRRQRPPVWKDFGSAQPLHIAPTTARDAAQRKLQLAHPTPREQPSKAPLKGSRDAWSPALAPQFEKYQLSGFFDQRGYRLSNLPISAVAKLHPEVGVSFGSVAAVDPAAGAAKPRPRALASRDSQRTVERDREVNQQRKEEQFRKLSEEFRVQQWDVDQRSRDMLFFEIPGGVPKLPAGLDIKNLLLPEVSGIEERKERTRFEKQNQRCGYQTPRHLSQGWLLPQKTLIAYVNCWMAACGLCATLGVDRANFCRFLLDVCLVDQENVPYVWAISLFDHFARTVRPCGGVNCIGHHTAAQALTMADRRMSQCLLLCKWDFVVVINILLGRIAHARSVARIETEMQRVSAALAQEMHRQELRDMEASPSRAGCFDRRGTTPIASGEVLDPERLFRRESSPGAMADELLVQHSSMSWKRNRWMSGMLVEPDVLRLVEQYRGFFIDLFRCYVGDSPGESGSMDFGSFLQFCQDVQIVPRIASRHRVQCAYRAVESLERLKPNGEVIEAGRDSPTEGLEAPMGSTQTRRAYLDDRRRRHHEGHPPPRLSPRPGHMRGQASLSPPDSHQAWEHRGRHGGSPEIEGHRPLPHGGRRERRQSAPTVCLEQPVQVRFGLAAFVEALGRVAITHHVEQGNAVQRDSPSRAKMAWLIAYLFGVLRSLQQSHRRHREAGRRSSAGETEVSEVAETSFSTEVPDDAGSGAQSPTIPPSSTSWRLAQALDRIDLSAHDVPPPAVQKPLDLDSAPSSPLGRAGTPASPGRKAAGGRVASWTDNQGLAQAISELPVVQQDAFSFDDLLFRRLLQPWQRTSGIGGLVHAVPQTPDRTVGMPVIRPGTSGTLAGDQEVLLRDLNCPSLSLDRSDLTPPPLSPFGSNLGDWERTLMEATGTLDMTATLMGL